MIPVLRSIAHIRQYWWLAILAFTSLALATVFSLLVPQILRTVIDQGLPLPCWSTLSVAGLVVVAPAGHGRLSDAPSGLAAQSSVLVTLPATGSQTSPNRRSLTWETDRSNVWFPFIAFGFSS